MSKWEMVKLGEVSIIQGGYAFKSAQFTKNGVPIIRIGNLNGDTVDLDYDICYPLEFWIANDTYRIKMGDILVAMSGATVGKIGRYTYNQPALLNQRVGLIRIYDNQVFPNYVYHYVKSSLFLKQIQQLSFGCAQPNISAKNIESISIPIPPLETQKQIAKTLDTAVELLAMRKQQLAELENLINSTFYDMFGDPVINEKGWALKKLPKLVAKSKNSLKRGPFGGALKKEIFVDEGYLVYEQNHALNNDYSFKRYFIDQKTFNQLKDFEVKPGDILISCSGVYLGKLSIVPKDALPGVINQALLKVTLDNKEMNQIFFVYVFGNPNFKNQHITSSRGSGIPNLPPMSVIKNINFITPPISIQNQFAEMVIKIEEQKALVQKAIDETQYLFDSLMNEYFD
ncbi:restriction endonuclease subunit S [Syntrophomonas wolfei]|uniref:restriction endonuclease subunit S n=1 Tax=Syntrophomonas wolfei TaxID=863 RepID=UPI0007735666|nr:restriction endonuclease subunit S [Syntrophomonas wolfei]